MTDPRRFTIGERETARQRAARKFDMRFAAVVGFVALGLLITEVVRTW